MPYDATVGRTAVAVVMNDAVATLRAMSLIKESQAGTNTQELES